MTDSVVLLHGWPGTAADFREVIPLLPSGTTVYAPDLDGFGRSAERLGDPAEATAAAHAARLLEAIAERGLVRPVLAGYDVGSWIAQVLAKMAPEAVSALVLTPPYAGIGERRLEPAAQEEFWYMTFHRLAVADQMLDGNRAALEPYLRHIWTHWSGTPSLARGPEFEQLVDLYARRGAFAASLAWYRMNVGGREESGPIGVPTTMLWSGRDPLFPLAWADRLEQWFTDLELRVEPEAGHFLPLQAPAAFATAICERL
ncbi:MAG TPA: alpha/beta hydrolase [Solirubrobacterales bacterium]|nr:alpha/beta hydrolase [Solirubrobacterales bacterium]